MFIKGFNKTAQMSVPAVKPVNMKPPNIGATFTQPQSNSIGKSPNVGPNT